MIGGIEEVGMLIFFCGKMGAGKSTKSKEIAQQRNRVLLSEDVWLQALYPNKIRSLNDYIKYSNRIKPLVKNIVQGILVTGTNVVLDFPANTIAQREWIKSIYKEINAPHELIYLDVSNEICLKQISNRRDEQPERSTTDTEEMFNQVTKYFVEPGLDERFNVIKIEKHA